MPKIIRSQLTTLKVKNAGPGKHLDGQGLYLVVKPSGSRSWVYIYTMAGKTHQMGLGSASKGGVSLADARKHAIALRQTINSGLDPQTERENLAKKTREAIRQEKVSRITFKEAAEEHISAHESGWRNAKHRQQWRNSLATHAYPTIGDIPVANISTEHIEAVLKKIWTTTPETASRVRGRIEIILDSARVKGYRSKESPNPARWKGHLKLILPSQSTLTRGHHKTVHYNDMPAFMKNLQSRKAISALALEFTILTAARTSEVREAKWEEFNLNDKVWTVPALRMKTGREHQVPLVPRAVEILHKMKDMGDDYVFMGNHKKPMSDGAMLMLLRRMKHKVTVHGFRSSFRDWAADKTDFPNEVCEMALAHTIKNQAEAAYRRGDLLDKRRRLMEAWADYVYEKPTISNENLLLK